MTKVPLLVSSQATKILQHFGIVCEDTNNGDYFGIGCENTNNGDYFGIGCENTNNGDYFGIGCEDTNNGDYFSIKQTIAQQQTTQNNCYNYENWCNKWLYS